MQLLVFAHTPPPVHGQSLMVQTLLEGLPRVAPEIKIFHVNPRLSRDAADIGSVRIAKLFRLVAACFRAITLRLRHGPMIFYYVPAPAKRGALYRDWIVMLLCRPFFSALVLHWHAVGLGAWLRQQATAPERWLTHWLLGKARLSIVLAEELAADANQLSPLETAVVSNGIEVDTPVSSLPQNPGTSTVVLDWPPAPDCPASTPTDVLFLGLGCREKGLFDLLTAIAIANRLEPDAFRLTVAGGFASSPDQHAFFSQALALGPDVVRYVGFVNAAQKSALFAGTKAFCFPTSYPHEGQPLTLIEALAHDVPIITTRWRAIPGMLPSHGVWLVDPGRPDQIAEALLSLREKGHEPGPLREHYLTNFRLERHLRALAKCLSQTAKARTSPF